MICNDSQVCAQYFVQDTAHMQVACVTALRGGKARNVMCQHMIVNRPTVPEEANV